MSTLVPILLACALLLHLYSLGEFTENQMYFAGKGVGFCKTGLQMFCFIYGATMFGAFISLGELNEWGMNSFISLSICIALFIFGIAIEFFEFKLDFPSNSIKDKLSIRAKSKFLILISFFVFIYPKVVWVLDVWEVST
ncbi:hypothetical protein [Moritella viscosa]|uniref:hypothetical protein n=1 Tax=Moritella viscosa TaxID=80854 RepID=UPI0011608566|nr:hypothetical protein [Moritella viscosa]